MLSCVIATGVKSSWGDFQSLLQLSIAINAAFIAFAGFFGDIVDSRKQHISFMMNKLSDIPVRDMDGLSPRSKLISLSGKLDKIEKSYKDFVNGRLKILSMLAIPTAIILLVTSSYHSKCKMSPLFQSISVLHLLPFMFGMLYYALTVCRLYVSFYHDKKLALQ